MSGNALIVEALRIALMSALYQRWYKCPVNPRNRQAITRLFQLSEQAAWH